MLVPATEVASTSPSPLNLPPDIETVALASLRSSGSVAETADDNVTGAPSSVKAALVATLLQVGGSLTLVTLTVVVCGALPTFAESAMTQVMVRVGLDPKSVG